MNRVSLVQREVQVLQDQTGPMASLVNRVFEVLQEKKVAHYLDRKVTRVIRGSRVLLVPLRSWTLQVTYTSKESRVPEGQKEHVEFQVCRVWTRSPEKKERRGLWDFLDQGGSRGSPVCWETRV